MTGEFHPGGKKSGFFYGYVVLLASFISMMVTFGTLFTFGVFFKPLSDDFGWTRAMTSGAYSLRTLLSTFLAILTGRLNDRFGPRLVITISGLFIGLGYLMMSQIGTVWQLYLFYGVIIGVGMSASYVPVVSTLARWFVRRRGLVTGIAVSGGGVGIVAIPMAASWLISDYGWRDSYIIMGAIALVFTIVTAQFMKRDPGQMGQSPYGQREMAHEELESAAVGLSLRETVRTGQLWILSAMFFSIWFVVGLITVHIVPHATDLGISPASAAGILAVIGGVNIVGKLVVGNAADRSGNKPSLLFCFALTSLVLFCLLVVKEVWMFYLFAVIFGFTYGGLVVLESPLIAELFGMSSHGVIFGVVEFISSIGGVIGPLLAGYIFDITDSYNPAFLICAAIAAIGLALAWFLKPVVRR